jgi:hypothetical protein
MTAIEDVPDPQKLPEPPIDGSFWTSDKIDWKQEPPYDPSPPWGIAEEELRIAETGGKLKISYIITSTSDLSQPCPDSDFQESYL